VVQFECGFVVFGGYLLCHVLTAFVRRYLCYYFGDGSNTLITHGYDSELVPTKTKLLTWRPRGTST